MRFAAYNGHAEVVELLLGDKRIDANAKNINGYTALMFAAAEGHTEVVKLLLGREDIDVNARDKKGWTALMYAAEYGNREVIKLLLCDKRINREEAKEVAKNYGYTFEFISYILKNM